MKKLVEITLGILTAIGAFVDIGDIVASGATGARFRLTLVWVLVLGTLGICLYAEMAGRVAVLSKRAAFDVARERLGPRIAGVNLAASFTINLMTLAAEIGGLAIVIQLATNLNYIIWIPFCAVAVWIVMWRMKFQTMERTFGLLGLALLVLLVAVYTTHPDYHAMWQSTTHPWVPSSETHAAYWYWAVSILGATMTVYEPFFFSSGAIEEKWDRSDLVVSRTNVYIGFPLGALLSLSLMVLGAHYFAPRGIEVESLSQDALPIMAVLGKAGLAFLLLGMFAAFFAAALETGLSAGYIVCQFFGWPWGKAVKPREAARFHLIVLATLVVAVLLVLSTADPIKVTEYSIVLVAVAAPPTYLPLLLAANDPRYVGDKKNKLLSNVLATAFFVILCIAAIAAIPLLIITKGGS